MKKPTRKERRKTAVRRKPQEKSASIEFCGRCGSILVPIKKGTRLIMKCRKCGTEEKKKSPGSLKIKQEINNKSKIIVLEKDISPLPITDMACEKCENKKAYWWMQQ